MFGGIYETHIDIMFPRTFLPSFPLLITYSDFRDMSRHVPVSLAACHMNVPFMILLQIVIDSDQRPFDVLPPEQNEAISQEDIHRNA